MNLSGLVGRIRAPRESTHSDKRLLDILMAEDVVVREVAA